MKRTKLFLATLMATTMLAAGSASAKTLIYCSEGSPEGFDPAPYTAGTTFDASSKPLYNRLVEFKRGTSEVIPGPGRKLGGFGRRPHLHLQAAPGCQVPFDRLSSPRRVTSTPMT